MIQFITAPRCSGKSFYAKLLTEILRAKPARLTSEYIKNLRVVGGELYIVDEPELGYDKGSTQWQLLTIELCKRFPNINLILMGTFYRRPEVLLEYLENNNIGYTISNWGTAEHLTEEQLCMGGLYKSATNS